MSFIVVSIINSYYLIMKLNQSDMATMTKHCQAPETGINASRLIQYGLEESSDSC